MRRLLALSLLLAACGEVDQSVIAGGEDGATGSPIVNNATGEMPNGCYPGVGAPSWWVEEGEELRVAAACGSGLEMAGSAFSIAPLPRGASYDAATGELRWIPALDQAGVYNLTVTAANGERGPLRISVADRFDAPGNTPLGNAAAYTEEMGLPVFHLTLDKKVNPDEYTPATIIYRGHTYKAEAKHRGNSSISYPKKNFTFKFPKTDRFAEPILGGGSFKGRKRISLVSAFDDTSYLRYRLAYALWNRMPGRIQVQTFSAVVYLNGAYQGLYTVVDHIDEDLMAAHGLDPKGNLFKSVGPDANFYPKDPISNVYEKKAGTPAEGQPGAFDDLQALTDFAVHAPDDQFRAEIGRRVNLDDYRDWMILATAISARDTLGKNAFHYHYPGRTPWRVVVWDFNHSFGQDWMTEREAPVWDPFYLASTNRIFYRLMEDPVLGAESRARYNRFLHEELPVSDVLDIFDGMVEEVSQSARRDERKWRQQHLDFERWRQRTDFTVFEGEVMYMRQWIRDRWAFLAKRLAPEGTSTNVAAP